MADQYEVTRNVGFFGSMGNAIKGVFFGIIDFRVQLTGVWIKKTVK